MKITLCHWCIILEYNMPRSSRNRDSGSQRVRVRSRHSGRSQSYHRSRHGRLLLKYKERNFLAAICSMAVIVILCSALAEPDWIYVRGGGCNVEKIGVHQFFFNGYFDYQTGVGGSPLIYHYGSETKNSKLLKRLEMWPHGRCAYPVW